MNFLKLIWRHYIGIVQKNKLYKFQNKWRSMNSHNKTSPLSIFPIDKVSVGKMCYGTLDIRTFGNPDEKLIIGDYVSISNNVIFILGGNHQINTITSYPLKSKLIALAPEIDAQTKGPIIIENEVWIGIGAIILSGIKICKGAIIAAGAIITKDVPSYAIVAGNPAKVIKYRFTEDIREALSDFSISQLEEKVIIDNIKEFYYPLDINQVEKFKGRRSFQKNK